MIISAFFLLFKDKRHGIIPPNAPVVKLADTMDLGTCTSNGMNTISNVPQTIEMTDFFRFLL